GLPLGGTDLLRPAAMANLLGDLWEAGEPGWAAALAHPEVELHLYGKATPRPGRKMGHLTALGDTREEALARVPGPREALAPRGLSAREPSAGSPDRSSLRTAAGNASRGWRPGRGRRC